MKFRQTKLQGVYVIELEMRQDQRGFFARTWCQKEFAKHNLETKLVQCSISFNKQKGTLRGMHYQKTPYEEVRLVRCTLGAIYDVVIDLRSSSPTFKNSIGEELNEQNHKMIYIPKGCAHGFLTLKNNTEVFYQMSEFYTSDYAEGVRFDDPAFAIKWPTKVEIISDRDKNFPNFL